MSSPNLGLSHSNPLSDRLFQMLKIFFRIDRMSNDKTNSPEKVNGHCNEKIHLLQSHCLANISMLAYYWYNNLMQQ